MLKLLKGHPELQDQLRQETSESAGVMVRYLRALKQSRSED